MNRVIGILAHVDAGKTTLSEQLLWHAGVLRRPGRVDHRDTLLDAHPLERQRGITIFSDQAVFEREGHRFFWVDTPGHTDFSSEMERALSILDYAVLVIDGAEGIQSHSETLWGLLEAYRIPVFLFINKTDRPACNAGAVLSELKRRFSDDMVDMQQWDGGELPPFLIEAVAERDEALFEKWMMDQYEPQLWLKTLCAQIAERRLFPVYRGSALNDEGVEALLNGLCRLTTGVPWASPEGEPFRGIVYKIRRDEKSNRLCFFKVQSGILHPREELRLGSGVAKVNELRLCSGSAFRTVPTADRGMLCAATGLNGARPGDLIGSQTGHLPFHTEPMMASTVLWDDAIPATKVLSAFRELEDEDPSLCVENNEATGSIDLRVMGRIQLEVLRQLVLERFGLSVDFGPLRVLYMETIRSSAIGIGHYEPLRHYAEVQLRLVPGERGSGITFESLCHVDELALNWQRLIETHVFEKNHKGVLIGAQLTDVRVQLLHGKAHLKHTEGGDFRQSTYRAIRNALMYAESELLEPICSFFLRAPADCYGRIVGDLSRMAAQAEPPVMEDAFFTIRGLVPLATISAYHDDYLSATHGRGLIHYHLDHYAPCRDAQTIIRNAGYNPLADDTPDSVFCSHGAGFTVPWNKVREYAHCPMD